MMDVTGRSPSSTAGEYFCINNWSWRPIKFLIIELCSDLLDEETLEAMSYNEGAGPDSQEICTEMANRFDRWMEHNVDGLSVDLGVHVDKDGGLFTTEEPEGDSDRETVSAHEVSDEHLKEWIEFL